MFDFATPYRFCPCCGKPLRERLIDDRLRSTCLDCSYVHWGNFSLGVGGVLRRENRVLLVQRKRNPNKGMWTIPGGFVDQKETLGDAVCREIQEETGIRAQALSIIALRDQPAHRNNTYVVFLMRDLGGELLAQPEEVSDLGFFSAEEYAKLNVDTLTLGALEASLSAAPGLEMRPHLILQRPGVLYRLP